MSNRSQDVPSDFVPITGCIPQWIDIGEVCKEAKRFVGLYAVANFDVVAINSGKAVYTTADRNGEFRRNLGRAVPAIAKAELQTDLKPDTLVYDCESRLEWLAPRSSAVRFLYGQF
jgi:hypothetical protein